MTSASSRPALPFGHGLGYTRFEHTGLVADARVAVETGVDGVDIVNGFAPEHLSLVSRKEKSLAPKIRTAGAIFLGNWSPVAVGDFLAGPSHELPTGGAGKSFPGLTVDQFQRRTSIVKLDRESIAKSAPIVEAFAKVEGLDAHGNSASIRVRR